MKKNRLGTKLIPKLRTGSDLQLGISIGAAVFPQDGESYEALLATADSRMYQDKAGRKRRSGHESLGHDLTPVSTFPDVTELDVQRAAAGIL